MTGLPRSSGNVVIRAWRSTDEAALVGQADKRPVSRNRTHLFPHPYTDEDAAEGVALCLGYIWDTFDVERLQAEVFAWNPASAGVLEKNGFMLEGTRRKAIFKDGELIDEWIYTLFRSETARP